MSGTNSIYLQISDIDYNDINLLDLSDIINICFLSIDNQTYCADSFQNSRHNYGLIPVKSV